MNNNNQNIYNSLTHKYFDKNILKKEKIRDALISFEELLNIKKNIKKTFKTDKPDELKKLIGKKINNIIVQEKDFKYAKIIEDSYKKIYELCKKLLKKENEI